MSGASGGSERKLNQTPTWAVAGVCAIIILVSLALEKGLHRVGKWLRRKHKRALYDALEKVKEELMVMGFISLILTFGERNIAKIHVPAKVANTMLPCELENDHGSIPNQENHRKLGSIETGVEPLVTAEAIHQLHILIFFLAFFHVLYSAVTMMLGRMKIRGWKVWELETSSLHYDFSNDPSRFRLTRETTFVKAHTTFWTKFRLFFYVGCFFRQFFRSVTRVDYLTLRHGFITAHVGPETKFNFQKYIKKSLEDDFTVLVEVSPVLWASFVIFLLLNVNGWHTLFWASVLPLITILAVGTKLQSILTKMALQIMERHSVVQGIPLVKGSDRYFWFSNPQLVLHLLHFVMFQNAFQITYFLWILNQFGRDSCFHDRLAYLLIKIVIGLGALVLCSYSTLPLYALVTQMGSRMKIKGMFDEQTAKMNAEKPPPRTRGGRSMSGKNIGSLRRHSSSGPSLHRFMTTGHSSCFFGTNFEDEGDESCIDNLIVKVDDDDNVETEMTALPNVHGGK